MGFGFIFGPVPSRRLGLSLGINIIPFKTCSYNCIYCEVGKTTNLTIERRRFFDPEEIKGEFSRTIDAVGRVDFVTFSGSGEPTLNTDIGELIRYVKSYRDSYRVAVLTNGSLMYRKDVRDDLADADVVIPSLDAAREDSFRRVNMPHRDLEIDRIIEGMAEFRRNFKAEMWLEVLFVDGVNDSVDDLDALVKAIEKISPSRVQIGTVDRPPAYTHARKVPDERMMDIYLYMSSRLGKIDLIGSFDKRNRAFNEDVERSIIKMINIRPCSEEELMEIFDIDGERLKAILSELFETQRAFVKEFGGKKFIVGNRSAANM